MADHALNPPAKGWSLTLPPRLWQELIRHMFPGDFAEHGAVILAGHADGPRGPRLLGRELIPARDGTDYLPGEIGHRALTATFVRDTAVRARDHGFAYIAVHNHGGNLSVGFSAIDLASHERGYPGLRQIIGQPVAGMVITSRAAAGDLWLPNGERTNLAEVVVPAGNLIRLRPRPATAGLADPIHDRQARLYGDLGQEALGQLRVGVVGLGGIGSIVVELLARLGTGELVLIDDQLVDLTNLPRMLAARLDDVGKPKTVLAARSARGANTDIRLALIQQRVETPTAQEALKTCDWIFLAADGHAARHYVNAAVHQYLIPATQLGVKIPVDRKGSVGEIHAVNRLFLPGRGCMWCNHLIDPSDLAVDMLPVQNRRAARYIDDIPAPSVIALNAVAAAEGVDTFMLAVAGLHHDDFDSPSVIHLPRRRERVLQRHRQDPGCTWCTSMGILGHGDHALQASPAARDAHGTSKS